MSDEWKRPPQPPPPLFLGKKERDLVKQVNDELIEKVIGQQVLYYPIDMERTNFHNLYGEAVEKTFLSPVRVYALILFDEEMTTYLDGVGIDRNYAITIHFHRRRRTEDKNLILQTSVKKNKGIKELAKELKDLMKQKTNNKKNSEKLRLESELGDIILNNVQQEILTMIGKSKLFSSYLKKVQEKKIDTFEAADKLTKNFLK